MKSVVKFLFFVSPVNSAVSAALLAQRIGLGLLMLILHGWPKFTKYDSLSATFPDPLGVGSATSLFLAVSAEVGASALLIIGLATRLVCIPLIFTMVVAAFLVHGDDIFGKGELALLYLGGYLTLLIAGPGRFSLDELLLRKLAN